MIRALSILFFLLSAPLPAQAAPDYSTLNRSLADKAVIPAYRALADAATTLEIKISAGCAAPSGHNRAEARNAFRVAMIAWQRARPVTFGPVAVDSRSVRIQFWPDRRGTGARQLRRAIRARDPALVAPGGIAGRSVALQGLGTIEALLYDHPDDPYACRMAAAIAAFQRETANRIVSEWADGFGMALTPSHGGNAHYADAREASTDFLRSVSTAINSIIDQKLERPLGEDVNHAAPRRAESWRSGMSLANIAANLETLGIWFSVPGGFRDQLARTGSAALGDGMVKAFRDAAALAMKIPVPLSQAVADPAHRRQVEALLASARDIRTLVRDVIARELDLTIGFNSLDGD